MKTFFPTNAEHARRETLARHKNPDPISGVGGCIEALENATTSEFATTLITNVATVITDNNHRKSDK
jgi:hypothetical protein